MKLHGQGQHSRVNASINSYHFVLYYVGIFIVIMIHLCYGPQHEKRSVWTFCPVEVHRHLPFTLYTDKLYSFLGILFHAFV